MSNIYCCRSFIKALRIIEVYKLSLCRIFLVFFFSSFCFFFHSMNCILFIIFSPHYFLFNWSSKTMIAIFTSRDHQTWKIRLQLHSIIVLYYSACIFPSSASTQLNSTQSQPNLRLRWSLFLFDQATLHMDSATGPTHRLHNRPTRRKSFIWNWKGVKHAVFEFIF